MPDETDDNEEDKMKTDNTCYDCGSTIAGHHTPLCDMAWPGSKMDLPAILGTQWWIGEMPESAGDLRNQTFTREEVAKMRGAK